MKKPAKLSPDLAIIPEVDVETAQQWLISGDAALIDVREMSEYTHEHIPQAQLHPMSSFVANDILEQYKNIDKLIIQCQTGGRSAQVTEWMVHIGRKQVYNLVGGIEAWKDACFEVNRGH